MKAGILFLLLSLVISAPASAQRTELVELQGAISDYAEVVAAPTKDKIRALADDLKRVTSVNLRVVVLRSIDLIDEDTYGRQLYDRWDIGQSKEGLQHGVLLLISILDRKAKIIAGREVEGVLTPEMQDKIEWSVLAALSRGQFSDSVEIGATAISQVLIAGWPRTDRGGLNINWQAASLPLFLLFVAAVGLTLIVGGGFLMFFGISVGGLFGYIFLGGLGMFLGAALGFYLNYGRKEQVVVLKIETMKTTETAKPAETAKEEKEKKNK